MDDIHQPNNPSHSKISLPTISRSIPVEIAALPASTRTSFTRVDHGTRPGSAAGDNPGHPDDEGGAAPDEGPRGGGGADAGAPPHDGVQPRDGEGEIGAAVAVVVPQVPQTLMQFLLVSGRRRSMAFDPETTVGRVKELVWNTWPNGTSPSPRTCARPMIRAAPGAPTRPDALAGVFFYLLYFDCGWSFAKFCVMYWCFLP
jgi:hypothetical protein